MSVRQFRHVECALGLRNSIPASIGQHESADTVMAYVHSYARVDIKEIRRRLVVPITSNLLGRQEARPTSCQGTESLSL